MWAYLYTLRLDVGASQSHAHIALWQLKPNRTTLVNKVPTTVGLPEYHLSL